MNMLIENKGHFVRSSLFGPFGPFFFVVLIFVFFICGFIGFVFLILFIGGFFFRILCLFFFRSLCYCRLSFLRSFVYSILIRFGIVRILCIIGIV